MTFVIKNMKLFWVVIFFRCVPCKDVAKLNAAETTYFLDTVFKTYDKKIAPPVDGPTNISVQMFIEDMVPVEIIHSHYSIDMYFRTYWIDPRLAYQEIFPHLKQSGTLAFSDEFVSSIWVPDIFFPEMKMGEVHSVTKPNRLIRLKSDGWIFFSQRLTLTVYCQMELHQFPFDDQHCNFSMLSFAYNSQDIQLSWNTNNNGPIYPPNDKNMFEFTFSDFNYGISIHDYGVAGTIDTLYTEFLFTRNQAYYIIQMYLPCQLIVVLSWIGFWIDYRSTPARVSLGITTVLTMATLSNTIRASVPQTLYTKSIDIYLLVCFFYVFSALIEYAIVNITHMKIKKKQETFKKQMSSASSATSSISGFESYRDSPANVQSLFKKPRRSRVNKTEEILSESSFDINVISPTISEDGSGITNPVFLYGDEITDQSTVNNKTNKKNKFKIARKQFRKTKSKIEEKILEHNLKNLESHFIDKLSRYIFPISFIVLNVIYFTYHETRLISH